MGSHSLLQGISQPRDWTQVFHIAGGFFTIWDTKEAPWRREWLPALVFWPGEFHGLYSPWGRKELDTAEWLSLSLHSSSGPILFLLALETLSTCIHSSWPWLNSLVLSHTCPCLSCHFLPFYSNPPSFLSPNLVPLSATTQALDSVCYLQWLIKTSAPMIIVKLIQYSKFSRSLSIGFETIWCPLGAPKSSDTTALFVLMPKRIQQEAEC